MYFIQWYCSFDDKWKVVKGSNHEERLFVEGFLHSLQIDQLHVTPRYKIKFRIAEEVFV